MCLKLKDILHPFNIFGKNIQYVEFKTTGYENPVVLPITIVGDWAEFNCTLVCRRHQAGKKTMYINIPHKQTVYQNETITIPTKSGLNPISIKDDKIIIRCCNVTSLVVDDETLI